MQLQDFSQKLKKTQLFNGPTMQSKFRYKQKVFLVAAGAKPVCEVVSYHWFRLQGRLEPVCDKPKEIINFLSETNLYYQISCNHFPVRVIISKTRDNLYKIQDAIKAKSFYRVGKFFGYPETAVKAFLNYKQECLSFHEQNEMLKTQFLNRQVTKLINFRLSKKNYLQEIEEVKSWFNILNKYKLI